MPDIPYFDGMLEQVQFKPQLQDKSVEKLPVEAFEEQEQITQVWNIDRTTPVDFTYSHESIPEQPSLFDQAALAQLRVQPNESPENVPVNKPEDLK